MENRNHVWRDLFRLVDVASIEIAGNSSIFQVEHASNWTLRHKTVVENRNHVWRDLFRLVDVESIEIAGNSSIFQVEHASNWTLRHKTDRVTASWPLRDRLSWWRPCRCFCC